MEKRWLKRGVALVVALVLGIQPTLVYAAKTPTNTAIATAQAQAQAARKKLDAMSDDVESASEDYFAAKEKTAATTEQIKQTNELLAQAEAELDASQGQLSERSAAVYRNGEYSLLEILVGADSFQDLVTRLDLMRLVAKSDADLVRDIRDARAKIENTKKDLIAQQAQEKKQEAAELKEYEKVKGLVDAQKAYLSSLDNKVFGLINQERKRLEEVARKKAAAEAAAAAAAAKRREAEKKQQSKPGNTGGGSGGTGGSTGGGSTATPSRPSDESNLGGSHPEVVTEARKYIGVTPYVWGGTTPSGFDCSGLTMYCYKQATGMNISRTSRSQFTVGDFIPRDRKDLLKPGDLVFFGTNADDSKIHHVGIYSGNGMMIHSPQTGQKVKESTAFRSDYVGAVRP
jgi:cell wall-associated NlpC family hydrolase